MLQHGGPQSRALTVHGAEVVAVIFASEDALGGAYCVQGIQ